MRKLITAGLAAAAIGAALGAGAGTAQADVGDGSWACNNTEICFRKSAGSDRSIKHFFNGANHSANARHGAYTWGGPAPGGNVTDDAREFRNRDSQCTVYVWDITSTGSWFAYAHQPAQSNTWFYDLKNRNNGHSRCSNTQHPADL
ncbi:MAG TPA: hypothetical protein VFV67_10700 [Actinophytocola sp.]|uniref:hypothetical protein n=1 Tax=Actinophytocola sp. TaxID=1872138 RepID=UPI002DB92E82|nr:hypothetical protein [Actinophytocola sp.]HEU5471113.1 hypothetical protein [Actinophytocola sp.]